MKQKLLIAAAASAMLAVPSFAAAQDGHKESGWYLKGAVGYGAHTDVDIDGDVIGDVESEGNVAANLGLGYDFGENWRVELDGTTLFTDLGAIAQQPDSFAKLRTDALMLNAIYDFSDFDRWSPYVGAGVGIVRGDATAVAHDFLNGPSTLVRNSACAGSRSFGTAPERAAFSCDFSDEDLALGWQLLAGLGYAVTDNLTWDTTYRYLDSGNLDFDGAIVNGVDGSTLPGNAEFEDVGAHTLMTGFRYRFGDTTAATPPPPPPPPVQPVADYKCWDGSMVFNAGQCPAEPVKVVEVGCWDGSTAASASECPVQPTVTCWDGTLRYNLNECPAQPVPTGCTEQYRQEIIYYEFDKGQSAETRNAISRVLDAGQFCNVQGIRVVGHTDTSGAASYNLGLSKRRASDALEELVRQGVNRSVITSEGKGETEPFVDTGDGVREQLNRRTEVLLTLGSIDGLISN